MLFINRQWLEDIDRVIDSLCDLSAMKGKTLLITGVNGLVCSAVAELIFRYNDTHDGGIRVLAAGRSFDRIRERFGDIVDRDDFTFVHFDALEPECCIEERSDLIIHGAGNAFPGIIMKEPVETLTASLSGTKALLDYAGRTDAERFLYISSSEVYGRANFGHPLKENEYGYVDILNPRSSYSLGKMAAENLCISYSEEYGPDAVIARPGHIYGPTASRRDNRVSSVWAYAAAEGRNIVMKSNGAQIRSYCYCLDCASAILTMLISGENRCAYNISNPDSVISIRKMAEILSESSGVRLVQEIPDSKERQAFNPMDDSSLDGSALIKLGWKGLFDAETGLRHTVEILKWSDR